MQVDLNNVRLSAAKNLNLLIKFLNALLTNDTISEFNIDDCDDYNWQNLKTFNEIIDDLRSDIVVIGCCYLKDNDELKDISDQINIDCFNDSED
jgi:hypothetical protein